jgi:hypothetical protein
MSSETLNFTETERAMLSRMYYACDEREAIAVYRAHVASEKAQLEAKLAEARKDSERLDWLQAQEVKRALETNTHGPEFDYLVLSEDGTTCWGKTYRAAIDAAMKP